MTYTFSITAAEAAVILGISKPRLSQLVSSQKLVCVYDKQYTGKAGRGLSFFSLENIEEYKAAHPNRYGNITTPDPVKDTTATHKVAFPHIVWTDGSAKPSSMVCHHTQNIVASMPQYNNKSQLTEYRNFYVLHYSEPANFNYRFFSDFKN
jgi:hypothetical protein